MKANECRWVCGCGARWDPQKMHPPWGAQLRAPLVAGRPAYVLFDAWSPSNALLKHIRDDGRYVVWGLTRRTAGSVAGPSGHSGAIRTGPDWLSGGLKGLAVRDDAKDYATHGLTLPAGEVRQLSRGRAPIEEVFRVYLDHCGLNGYQACSERAQLQHPTRWLVAFVRARERHHRRLPLDKLKRHLSCHGCTVGLPALERLGRTASLLRTLTRPASASASGGRAPQIRQRGRDRRARTDLSHRFAFGEALVVRTEYCIAGYAPFVRQGARRRSPCPWCELSGHDGAAYDLINRLCARPR